MGVALWWVGYLWLSLELALVKSVIVEVGALGMGLLTSLASLFFGFVSRDSLWAPFIWLFLGVLAMGSAMTLHAETAPWLALHGAGHAATLGIAEHADDPSLLEAVAFATWQHVWLAASGVHWGGLAVPMFTRPLGWDAAWSITAHWKQDRVVLDLSPLRPPRLRVIEPLTVGLCLGVGAGISGVIGLAWLARLPASTTCTGASCHGSVASSSSGWCSSPCSRVPSVAASTKSASWVHERSNWPGALATAGRSSGRSHRTASQTACRSTKVTACVD